MKPHHKIFLTSMAQDVISLFSNIAAMKIIFLFCLLFIIPLSSCAQEKDDYIKPDDAIIGVWQSDDYETNKFAGVPLLDKDSPNPILHFEDGNTRSYFAMLYIEGEGFGCPSYFIAHVKKNTISGIVKGACMPAFDGLKFSFDCKYNKCDNSLTIIYKGKKYKYVKFKGK